MEFHVTEKHEGVLLRSYLKGTCGVSSRLLIRLKQRADGITVNGSHATVRYVLHAGDVVRIAEQDDRGQDAFEAIRMPVPILYEDDALLVVDKPPQMPTHPSAGHNGDTLANALAELFASRGETFVFRPVSRLDRNTSGVLTLAKNQYVAAQLCKAMSAHRIHKTYLAITDGVPLPETDVLETGTRRQEAFFVLREVCPLDAPDACRTVTEYRVLAHTERHALVKLHPRTGRTHQLRVHMAHLGCPILGDDLYGTPSPLLARHALHATSVEFEHPISGESLCIRSPFPPDLQACLAALGLPEPF